MPAPTVAWASTLIRPCQKRHATVRQVLLIIGAALSLHLALAEQGAEEALVQNGQRRLVDLLPPAGLLRYYCEPPAPARPCLLPRSTRPEL